MAIEAAVCSLPSERHGLEVVETMSQTFEMVSYRLAIRDDETDILAVLEEVSSEIPVRLDGEERQERIQIVITECHQSKESWVAIDQNGKVVGFLLARPDAHDGKAAIFIQYAGVSVGSRRRGIFSTLMEKQKAKGVPLKATVLHDNKSGMADRLVAMEFTKTESNAKQTQFLWLPN